MTRFKHGFIALALLSFVHILSSAPLHAQTVGADCAASQIGASTMTSDKKHIVACLVKDSGVGQEWKAFSQGGGGSLCGSFPYKSVTYHVGDCNPNKIVFDSANAIPCQGYAVNTCPSGYTRKILLNHDHSMADGCGGTSDYGAKLYSCVKD